MADKHNRLRLVQIKLMEVLDFLSDYLPLVNCHSNDFLLNNHWETFLSEPIRRELDSLSAGELVSLLSQTQSAENEVTVVDPNKYCNPSLWNFKCEYLISAAGGIDKKSEIYKPEMQKFSPEWVHEDLKSFLQDAKRCSLHNSDVLSNVDNLENEENMVMKDSVFISTFMNQKKTHEVEVMGELCFKLSQKYGTDVVVDLGSGKGYLSTHLAFQHKLSVIGVDAQTINTKGASKRADILSRQWEGLTRNEVLRAQKTGLGKLGKKKKKELKKHEGGVDITQKQGDVGKSSCVSSDISDNTFKGFSEFFEEQEGTRIERSCDNVPVRLDPHSPSQIQDCSDSMMKKQGTCDEEKQNSANERLQEKSEHIDNSLSDTRNNFPVRKENEKTSALKAKHFPITTYIDTDSDLSEIVTQALNLNSSGKKAGSTSIKDSCENRNTVEQSKDLCVAGSLVLGEGSSLMLTGLHTCGALGSNILRLFVNSTSVKVLCNVACCYHLMSEKYVASPFEDKEDLKDEPGFPLSDFLTKNKVGIGRQARNLASQSVNRRAQDAEVLAKQFPRMLLQKILHDQLGFVRSDWKGLRKLDQKSTDMFDYVTRAFVKLGLPTDGINKELVESYCEKYKDQRQKFAAFFQLKTALAPCIEAVIILDRLCFLLEQECVQDAKLLQLFDPVTSPRCYGIVSVKM